MSNETSGQKIAKHFEGLRLKAYQCPAGIWSIGYGSTQGVKMGMVITYAEALIRLDRDWLAARRDTLRLCPHVADGRLEALVDFTYNLGAGRLAASTLRRLVNRGEWARAANEFPKWVYGGGRKLPGLVARRAVERELFSIGGW